MLSDYGSLEDIELEVKKIAAEVASLDIKNIDPKMRLKEIGLDSMMALEVMAGIERRYKIHFQEQDLPKMTSVNEAVKLIISYLEKKS